MSEPRAIGRPRINPAQRTAEQHVVAIRLTDEQMVKLRAWAAHDGVMPGRFATNHLAAELDALDWPDQPPQEALPLNQAS